MLFELLTGMRLVHACTFFDGGGGGGVGSGLDLEGTLTSGLSQSEIDAMNAEVGKEAGEFSSESMGTLGIGGPGGFGTGTQIGGGEPELSSFRQGGEVAGGEKSGGVAAKAEEKPAAEEGNRRMTREQKRRRKSILGSEEWSIYAPGRKKTLLGE